MTCPKETSRARARAARLEWSHLVRPLPLPGSRPFTGTIDTPTARRASHAFHTLSDQLIHRGEMLLSRIGRHRRAIAATVTLLLVTSLPTLTPASAASHPAYLGAPALIATVSTTSPRTPISAPLTPSPMKAAPAKPNGASFATAPSKARVFTARRWVAAGSPSAEQIAEQNTGSPLNLTAVIAQAKALIGVPYQAGGGTPNGFDCSGYVRFVYAQTGLLLPHSASAQHTAGTPIDVSLARPGDLVIWNDRSHSAIYAGHGQIFHAPKPGGRVELIPIFTDAVHYVRLARD